MLYPYFQITLFKKKVVLLFLNYNFKYYKLKYIKQIKWFGF